MCTYTETPAFLRSPAKLTAQFSGLTFVLYLRLCSTYLLMDSFNFHFEQIEKCLGIKAGICYAISKDRLWELWPGKWVGLRASLDGDITEK